MDDLIEVLARAPGPDVVSSRAVAERAARALRPPGSLARLDAVAVWLAGWQHTDRPAVERPVLVVAAGDHGVAGRGVTPYPSSATATVVEAIRAGVATSAVMGRSVGASVVVVDAGVGRPSGDLVVEPALPEGRWAELVAIGRGTVAGLDTDLLLLGEMGIGNTLSLIHI